jgi:hypothetical protein
VTVGLTLKKPVLSRHNIRLDRKKYLIICFDLE